MSTRSSLFIETEPGIFYGVYRHYDGYPCGAGRDILEAESEGLEGVKKLMNKLFARYDQQYEDYSESDIFEMWKLSDHEYGYIRRLDGTWEVYAIHWGDRDIHNKLEDYFINRNIERIPGTLKAIVEHDENIGY